MAKRPRLGGGSSSSSSREEEEEDRIGALPDAVLQRILSLLPISAAARTSALSRRWRLLWTAVPSLNLHHHQGAADGSRSYHRFVLNMLSALLRRSSSDAVRSLRFHADHPHVADADADAGPSSPCCAADEIAAFALRSGAQELFLDFRISSGNSWTCAAAESEARGDCNPQLLHAVPLSLLRLSPSTLRVLRLKDCRIRVPSGLLAPQLETLWLTRVYPAEGGGDGLIVPLLDRLVAGCPGLKNLGLEGYPHYRRRRASGAGLPYAKEDLTLACPQLTHLSVRCCRCFGAVRIDAPRLESLEYAGAVRAQFVLAAGSPGPVRAEIMFCNYGIDFSVNPRERIRFLCKFRSLQFLRVRAWNLEDILWPRDVGFKALPIYHQLKHLELQGMSPASFVKDESIHGLVSLLAEMPILEHLTLELNTQILPLPIHALIQKCFWDKEPDNPKLKGAPVNCLKYNLKTVRIFDLQETELHVALVKYLLRNALVLDDMLVRVSPALSANYIRIQREILKLRLNPNTRVIMI